MVRLVRIVVRPPSAEDGACTFTVAAMAESGAAVDVMMGVLRPNKAGEWKASDVVVNRRGEVSTEAESRLMVAVELMASAREGMVL